MAEGQVLLQPQVRGQVRVPVEAVAGEEPGQLLRQQAGGFVVLGGDLLPVQQRDGVQSGRAGQAGADGQAQLHLLQVPHRQGVPLGQRHLPVSHRPQLQRRTQRNAALRNLLLPRDHRRVPKCAQHHRQKQTVSQVNAPR